MALVFFHTRFRGREYELDVTDITTLRLLQMRQWFGKEYGTFNGLPQLIGELDGAAWACALWIGAQKHGYPSFDPRTMDFHFDEFEAIEEPEVEEEEELPTNAAEVADTQNQTADSPSTASSDSDQSSSSGSSKPATRRNK